MHVFVFEGFEFFFEDDAVAIAVAVDQCKGATGFGLQGGFDYGEYGGDAAACYEGGIVLLLFGVKFGEEAATWWEYFKYVAGFEELVGVGAEPASLDLFDGDAQFLILGCGADGVGSADFFAVEYSPEGNVLSGGEQVLFF